MQAIYTRQLKRFNNIARLNESRNPKLMSLTLTLNKYYEDKINRYMSLLEAADHENWQVNQDRVTSVIEFIDKAFDSKTIEIDCLASALEAAALDVTHMLDLIDQVLAQADEKSDSRMIEFVSTIRISEDKDKKALQHMLEKLDK